MPLLHTYTSPLRAIWKIEEPVDELISLLGASSSILPLPDTIRIEKRQKEWIVTRLLIRELLGEDIPVLYHPNGSPYFGTYPCSLSISHTQGYVAVLIQKKPLAGIDIEYTGDRILRIRHKFISAEEDTAIDAHNEKDHLLIYWCAKETLFKMIEQDGVDFRTHLHVAPFPLEQQGSIIVRETRTSCRQTFHLRYQITPGYVWVWNE